MKWIRGDSGAAKYCAVSPSTWKRLKARHPVRRVKLPSGSVLYSEEWLDEFLVQWAETGCDVDRMVEEILNEKQIGSTY